MKTCTSQNASDSDSPHGGAENFQPTDEVTDELRKLVHRLSDLDERENIFAIACDTDGIDGSEDNAGAYLEPSSMHRARLGGLQAKAQLAANDAFGFFAPLDDLIVTGPTRTNVNDYRVILIV